MAVKPQKNGNSPWRAAGMVGAMGLEVAVCLFLGYLLGKWASGMFGGPRVWWVIGGMVCGLAVAVWSMVRLVKKMLEDSDG